MCNSIVVLKFGSSILIDEPALATAVAEIQRLINSGRNVIAIVSAFAGQTDRLFAATQPLNITDPYQVAEFVAAGELHTTELMRIALESVGVACVSVGAADICLQASGDALNSDPVALAGEKLTAPLANGYTVVVPGFLGVDLHGRTVLLGRGGSDETALFIAQQLGAECRLIKDVDGIFAHDPALPGPTPARYRQITWQDAASMAGVLVQPKAIHFAENHQQTFHVVAIQSDGGTTVGPGPSLEAVEEPGFSPCQTPHAMLAC